MALKKQAGWPQTVGRGLSAVGRGIERGVGRAGLVAERGVKAMLHPVRTVGGAAVLGAKALGTQALAHPMGALVGGLGAAAAYGKARSTMAQFNPAVHRAQLGIPPQ
jgi:hypothetical protein